MFPRIPSSPLFRNTYRHVRKPSRLTLGAAVATAAVAAGVVAGVSAGAAPASGAVSGLAAVSHTGAVRAASFAGVPVIDAGGGQAPSGHAALAAASKHLSHRAPVHARPASADRRRHRQAAVRPARPTRPYLIYDSVTPAALPVHHVAATYATGNYAASPAQVAGHRRVLWIDTTGTYYRASVLDVEPGDATPSMAASWAWHRLSAQPNTLARIYTYRSQWPAVKAAIATLPARMRSHVRWWIADPTGVPHIVPGSSATQWYWGSNYDITTATPHF